MPNTIWPEVQLPNRFNTGQIVFSGTSRGRVTVVNHDTFSVVWEGGDGDAVVYPTETSTVRNPFPWE
jgi:hypothetical protein